MTDQQLHALGPKHLMVMVRDLEKELQRVLAEKKELLLAYQAGLAQGQRVDDANRRRQVQQQPFAQQTPEELSPVQRMHAAQRVREQQMPAQPVYQQPEAWPQQTAVSLPAYPVYQPSAPAQPVWQQPAQWPAPQQQMYEPAVYPYAAAQG